MTRIVRILRTVYKTGPVSGLSVYLGTGIAQSIQRVATGWTIEGSEFESRYDQEFSLPHVFQTGSVVYSAYYTMDTGGLCPSE
jgi:hypothetical protein